MQLNPLEAVNLVGVPTGATATARVLAGDLAAVPVGELLQAVVTSATPREAVLNVNGQALTVRLPSGPPLQAGAALLLRVPPTAANAPNPTVELAVPANTVPNQKPTAGVAPRAPESAPRPASGQSAPVATRGTSIPTRVESPVAPAVPNALALTPPRLAVVDVLGPLPDGRVRVQIDGVEQVATTAEPVAPGGRYLLQVERSSVGIKLTPPPQSAALPAEVATAVLRAPAPTLPDSLKPLRAELAALAAPPTPGAAGRLPAAVREAAVAIEATLRTIVPSEPKPPDATQLRQLVENGGLHFEAKLARLVEGPDAPLEKPQPNAALAPAPKSTAPAPAPNGEKLAIRADEQPVASESKPATPAKPDATDPAAAKPEPREQAPLAASRATTEATTAKPHGATELGPDLKGDLLRLLQAVNDLSGTARAPAAEAAVRGIEAQQAANALAQANNAPYFLQVPFPDGGEWRTLRLSLEPQHRPDQAGADRAGRFRVFMHVPLTDLGETWIDAGLSGEQFRATIYLDRAAVRDRVRAALPELHAELRGEGFSEVLLDVRSSGELPEGRRREAGAMQAGRPDSVSVLDVRA